MTEETKGNGVPFIPSVFNTLFKFELVSKIRVKNCISCSNNLVSNDEKYILKKYIIEYTDKGFRICYTFPEGKDFGRIRQIPFTGLGTFSKPVRGYLAKDIYIDVDAVNCHPVILRNEFIKKGIDTCIIDEYVNNKEEFLQKENITKEDFLKMINDEKFVDNNTTLTKLHGQIYNLLLPSLLKENVNINEFIKKSRSYNKHGAFIANYLQNIEFNILVVVSACSEKEGAFVDVFMHDGFFVRITKTVTEEYVIKEMIPKYEKVVFEQFGINMKYKVKPHDLSLIIPDNIGKTQLEMYTEALLIHTKKEELKKFGADVYKKKYNNPMYYEDYYYVYNNLDKNHKNKKDLNDFFDEIFDNDKIFNSDTKYKEGLFKYVKGKKNFKDFPEVIHSINYIAFKNGSLQLYPLKFFTIEEIKESEELMSHNARNYIDEDFNESIETPNFDAILNNQLTPKAYEIFRVMFGRTFFNLNIHDFWQVFMYIQGDPHTGKSTITNILSFCQGEDNVGTFNKGDKVFQLAAVYHKNIVMMSDIRDHKNYIDEEIVQKMASGEKLPIRPLNVTAFENTWCKPIMFSSNYAPEWEDSEGALRRRLVFFYFGNEVEKKDSEMEKKLKKEAANIIYRCIKDYHQCVEDNKGQADFSKIIPEELKLLKEEFKLISDPLSEFLSLGRTKIGEYYYSTAFRNGNITPVEHFKKRFNNWLSTTKHSQKYKLCVKSKEFKTCGFTLVSKTSCKSCGNLHIKNCCGNYNSVNRTTKQFFENMYLMKEDKYGKPVESIDNNCMF